MNNNIFYELKEKEFNADEQYRVVISGYEEGNDKNTMEYLYRSP